LQGVSDVRIRGEERFEEEDKVRRLKLQVFIPLVELEST